MTTGSGPTEIALEEAHERILDALRNLRFGAVEIQVHDSRIVRITRTEKVRVERVDPDAKGLPKHE